MAHNNLGAVLTQKQKGQFDEAMLFSTLRNDNYIYSSHIARKRSSRLSCRVRQLRLGAASTLEGYIICCVALLWLIA